MIRRVRDCDKCGKTEIENHISLKVPVGMKPGKINDDTPSLDEGEGVVVHKKIDLCSEWASTLFNMFVFNLDIESGKKLIASMKNDKFIVLK